MPPLQKYLDRYSFDFPKELIAQKPASPRDAARLLVYDRKEKKAALDEFISLYKYLPPRAVLVVNQTKVIPARLTLSKETGGKVRILFLEEKNGLWKVLSDKKLTKNQKLFIDSRHSFIVTRQKENIFFLKPSFSSRNSFRVLERYGFTPIPPYIKHSPLSERKLKTEYQAVFARKKGSVAAPTASLHFTNRLLKTLRVRGYEIKRLTLHVGLGTFSAVTGEQLKKGKLHREYYEIDSATAAFLNRAKREKRPIVAVGTTALRALEAAGKSGQLHKLHGETDLFIREGYRFRFINGLITNFHVPRSSLLMLVSAFMGRKEVLKLYELAIQQKFRLFSFGDGMFIR